MSKGDLTLEEQHDLIQKYRPLALSCSKTFKVLERDEAIAEAMYGLTIAAHMAVRDKIQWFGPYAKKIILNRLVSAQRELLQKNEVYISFQILENHRGEDAPEETYMPVILLDVKDDREQLIELIEVLKQWISRLTDDEQTIVELTRRGWYQKDIADYLGVSQPTVNRKLLALIKSLSQEFYESR